MGILRARSDASRIAECGQVCNIRDIRGCLMPCNIAKAIFTENEGHARRFRCQKVSQGISDVDRRFQMIFFDDRTDVAVLFISGITEGEDISDVVPETGYFEESLYVTRLTVAYDEQRELF